MSDQKKKFRILIVVLSLVLAAAYLVVSILTLVNHSAGIGMKVSSIFGFFALVSGAYYLMLGYSKSAAEYYKLFTGLFVLSQLVTLVAIAAEIRELLPILSSAVIFGLVIMIFIGKDLGRKKSRLICILTLAFCIIEVIAGMITNPPSFFGGDVFGTLVLGRTTNQLILACLLAVITHAKYVDKASRGRD